MSVALSMAKDELRLLLDSDLELDDILRAQLAFARVKGGRVFCELSDSQVDTLMTRMEEVSATASSRVLRRQFARLYDKLLDQLPEVPDPVVPTQDDLVTGFRKELHQDMQRFMEQQQPESVEEANALLQQFVKAYNSRPQADLLGFSPTEILNLAETDLKYSDSVVRVNPDIPFERVKDVPFLQQVRTFVGMLLEQDGTKATKAGNLNRAFVREIAPRIVNMDILKEYRLSSGRLQREADVQPLFAVRVVAVAAGLVRKYKGRFVVTRKGVKLQSEERAGALLVALFRTVFEKINLAWFGRGLALCPELQRNIYVSMAALARRADAWVPVDELPAMLLLPHVTSALDNELEEVGYYEIPEEGDRVEDLFRQSRTLVVSRIAEPLALFGLLELKDAPVMPGAAWLPPPSAVRKTSLFDEFLLFDWEGMKKAP